MIEVKIKPLSVNQAWAGQRFKTKDYKLFEREMLMMLPAMKVENPTQLSVVFGFYNKSSDIDNPLKMLIDCLQKKYGFNDSCIYRLEVEKVIVKKGEEFIKFELK